MEIKKTRKADMEGSKTSNFLMGIVLGLAVILVGFEWASFDTNVTATNGSVYALESEDMAITFSDPPPPPPPLPQPSAIESLTVVENDANVEAPPDFTTEDDQNKAQTETFGSSSPLFISIEEELPDVDELFPLAGLERLPEFPGGDTLLLKFLSSSIKYPAISQETNSEGKVICSFTINRDGSVADAKVLRGTGDLSLDREALRVINLMPKWKPGMQRGKPVRVSYTVPITFKLQR
jgi:protein TonB